MTYQSISNNADEVKPLMSVVLPVYNGGVYLAEAVDSILAQTFADFELIMIDDGSKDQSLEIMQIYAVRDSRVRAISRENRGLATTLNDAIDVARGSWIARMDQDDIAMPNRFMRQLEWLTQTDADICGSWVQLFGTKDGRVLEHAETDEGIRMELLFGTPFAHPSVMMKTSLARQVRYDKAWEGCEDYDLWERIARAGFKMANVPEVLLKYRQHKTQISSKASIHQQELSQKVRRRYWTSIGGALGIDTGWIDDVIKLRDPLNPIANMDNVDAAMGALLAASRDEAQSVVIDHAARLYFRAASFCPDVADRWAQLNVDGSGMLWIQIKLWIVSKFALRADGILFKWLKNVYWRFEH
jgi:glycosyltransferase involved in cell wall biosynthesis